MLLSEAFATPRKMANDPQGDRETPGWKLLSDANFWPYFYSRKAF